MNLSKEEKRDWMLKNCIDKEGDLDLKGLDFSDFSGDIYINEMKVKKDLHQNFQHVGGTLWQSDNTVDGNLYQGFQEVRGEIYGKVE